MSFSHELPPAVFLMGPTASGKTDLALQLIEHYPFEIISVDSALVYRDMNIGTAKPDQQTLQTIPHHLIDIRNPDEAYSAAQFREDALVLMQDITIRGNVPLLVGGTMLYFKALKDGLDDLPHANPAIRDDLDKKAMNLGWPALHQELSRIDPLTAARLKPNDAQRIQRALEIYYATGKPMSSFLNRERPSQLPFKLIALGLMPNDRPALHQRIAERFMTMLEAGLIDEVIALKNKYTLDIKLPSMRSVGYRQVWNYLEGEYDRAALAVKVIVATRQLAKRQMTWLRAMPDAKIFDPQSADLFKQINDCIKQAL